MTQPETDEIILGIKSTYDKISAHSQNAQLDSFLNYYEDSPYFLSISSDGKMNSFEEFKHACNNYYGSLKEQKITTIQEKFQVLDANHVILGWKGNITAIFKNGDIMNMYNYSITSVFKKIDEQWMIIHDHESALPPEIIKKE